MADETIIDVAEQKRLNDAREAQASPGRSGDPYLSERQWGTVREDYSDDGDAWNYFTHDQARSRAYRWGEDGLAGICDDQQRLCFALALWNGTRPDPEGAAVRADQQRGQPRRGRQGVLLLPRQHADALVHEVPVQVPAGGVSLRATWSRRTGAASREELEYELLDTGVFDDDRYFDVFVEYAKAWPEDMLVRITVAQPRAARPRGCTCCRRCGSATPGRGAGWRARSRSLRAGRRRASSRPAHPRARRVLALLRGRPGAAVHRERDEHGAALGPAERVALRQGRASTTTSSRGSTDAVNPAQGRAPRPRPTTRLDVPARR